jgi:hypothetical protein
MMTSDQSVVIYQITQASMPFVARSRIWKNEMMSKQITELDPGNDSWPFCDTIFFIGAVSVDHLRAELMGLQPDEVGTSHDLVVPDTLTDKNPKNLPVLIAWWD